MLRAWLAAQLDTVQDGLCMHYAGRHLADDALPLRQVGLASGSRLALGIRLLGGGGTTGVSKRSQQRKRAKERVQAASAAAHTAAPVPEADLMVSGGSVAERLGRPAELVPYSEPASLHDLLAADDGDSGGGGGVPMATDGDPSGPGAEGGSDEVSFTKLLASRTGGACPKRPRPPSADVTPASSATPSVAPSPARGLLAAPRPMRSPSLALPPPVTTRSTPGQLTLTLPTISLCDPYASAVLDGIKTLESRGDNRLAHYQGVCACLAS